MKHNPKKIPFCPKTHALNVKYVLKKLFKKIFLDIYIHYIHYIQSSADSGGVHQARTQPKKKGERDGRKYILNFYFFFTFLGTH